jgi:predicted nuclease of predicted toxin-antitoxin system
MRFLADMGVAIRVVEWLRDEGYDARHLREEELQRLPDDQIFRKAVAENRVVLTFDLDFGEIVASSGRQKVSVVLFPAREHSHSLRNRASESRFAVCEDSRNRRNNAGRFSRVFCLRSVDRFEQFRYRSFLQNLHPCL